MEAPERRDRVRPLPPEGETGESHRAHSVRALLPMLGGGLVLLAFIALITLGSTPGTTTDAGAPDSPPTTPTFVRPANPTTTLAVPTTIVTRPAPEFAELLPEFVGGMSAIVEREDGSVAVARWRLNRRFPQFTELAPGPGHSTFDYSGQLVASLGLGTRGGSAGLLSVGALPLDARPVFVAAVSYAWHRTEPGLLAVTGRRPADETHGVFLMQFESSGALRSAQRIADAGPTWLVAGFHDSGIALVDNDTIGTTLRIIDASGAEVAAAAGVTRITTDDYILGLEGATVGAAVAMWSWDLQPMAERPRFLGDGFDVPEIVSPNGRHAAELVRAQTSTVVVRSDEVVGPRSIGVQAPIAQAFFLTNDHIAVFSSAESSLLVIEWRTGITAEFELEGAVLRDITSPGYLTAQETPSLEESPPDDSEG